MKKRATDWPPSLCCFQLLFLLKGVLAEAADGALEVLGKLLEGGAGSDAVIGIADGGVVFVTARANVFHNRHSFHKLAIDSRLYMTIAYNLIHPF